VAALVLVVDEGLWSTPVSSSYKVNILYNARNCLILIDFLGWCQSYDFAKALNFGHLHNKMQNLKDEKLAFEIEYYF